MKRSSNTVKFVGSFDQLVPLLNWVRIQLEPTPLSLKEKNKVEIALEEAIVNIIEHGSKAKTIDLILTCHLEPKQQLEFVIKDNGPPFNPLVVPNIDRTELSIEEQKIGGVGISLMKQCMDALLYRREDELNVLTLIKNF